MGYHDHQWPIGAHFLLAVLASVLQGLRPRDSFKGLVQTVANTAIVLHKSQPAQGTHSPSDLTARHTIQDLRV
ncbi:hypothetical protein HRbin36_02889 [bacterium HR36]|nr:hypothetical protein HRbin36_02889 [bacterium HR36]